MPPSHLPSHTPEAIRPILLVEDNPMDVDLTLQGFDEHRVSNPIVVCRDGEEALKYMDAHALPNDPQIPILVLLDLRLPKVGGLEVLREARRRPVWKDLNIVVLTTSSENSDITEADALGANGYLAKPVDFLAFSDVIKHVKFRWLLLPDQQNATQQG